MYLDYESIDVNLHEQEIMNDLEYAYIDNEHKELSKKVDEDNFDFNLKLAVLRELEAVENGR